eukprot:TRINITY_DN2719_c0_g1_i1.p1 TRINITY_DN2719_c0_g1~~TRINITY_DN2719_c0_g1_i1.p1  ORF type:complete len:238 (-),score=51.38 TRINITY_DN2719_c0_g1_i1:119-832(-)
MVITIDKLPPLLSVPVDDLKLFSKTQLKVYLDAYGVQPLSTKPKIKTQVRDLMKRLKNKKTDGNGALAASAAAAKPTSSSSTSQEKSKTVRKSPLNLESFSGVVPGILTSQPTEESRARNIVLGKRKYYDGVSAGSAEDLQRARDAASDASADVMGLLSRIFNTPVEEDDAEGYSQLPSDQPRKRLKTLDEIGTRLEVLLSGPITDTTAGGVDIVSPSIPLPPAHELHPDRKLFTAL